MSQPNLLNNGDRFEQETWSEMKNHFRHYEILWRLHIYPLRRKDSILLRDGVDKDSQLLAMHHYSTYVNLARAQAKIEKKADELRFFDEIYANLQRSRELATKVVVNFRELYRQCLGKMPELHDERLSKMENRLRGYRNLIHKPLVAYVPGSPARIRIPKPDCIDKYKLWTSVFYHRNDDDFEDVEAQLRKDFFALCSALESVWREMCSASEALCNNPNYRELLGKGSEPQLLSVNAPAASGQGSPISSNTADFQDPQ